MRSKKSTALFFIIILLSCQVSNTAQTTNQLSQISTIDALLAGAYDGIFSTEGLLDYGNFGLGTFDKLDGEMIIYNGNIYQIKCDGSVVKNDVPVSTPFASVVNFSPDKTFTVNDVNNLDELAEELAVKTDNGNLPVAIKISGKFEHVKVRSVPPQEKPYPPLAKVTESQSVFEYDNIDGTLVGFYTPGYFKSLNVPGLHIHFLSTDETKGGHLLDLQLKEGKVEIDIMNKFFLYLPENSEHFNSINLQQDRSEELEKVEK